MLKLMRRNNKKGFTLVELIVVIAILAILALILIPAISGYVERANKSADESSVRALYSEAMFIAVTEDLDDDAATASGEIAKFVEDSNKLKSGSVTVVYDGTTVTSIKYNGVTFDGNGFKHD